MSRRKAGSGPVRERLEDRATKPSLMNPSVPAPNPCFYPRYGVPSANKLPKLRTFRHYSPMPNMAGTGHRLTQTLHWPGNPPRPHSVIDFPIRYQDHAAHASAGAAILIILRAHFMQCNVLLRDTAGLRKPMFFGADHHFSSRLLLISTLEVLLLRPSLHGDQKYHTP